MARLGFPMNANDYTGSKSQSEGFSLNLDRTGDDSGRGQGRADLCTICQEK